jgi:DNA repair exonuclease SbcCD ATPase subunit
MEDVVHVTDQIIAEKNQEIRDLQQQLAESGASGATKSAAIAHAIDSDAVVQEERQRLRQLEEEWQTKLRHAEIEISLERAKLARQRVELEERLRSAENVVSKVADLASAAASTDRPARGRWMSRLGLTDADRERGRRS